MCSLLTKGGKKGISSFFSGSYISSNIESENILVLNFLILFKKKNYYFVGQIKLKAQLFYSVVFKIQMEL